jgi:phosphinothricin acetyltransferase
VTHDTITIRDAVAGDAEAISEIYNHYVVCTTVTFDTEPETPRARAEWLASRQNAHPVLVAEIEGRVVGWASLSAHSPRPAWSPTVELGLYLAPDQRSRGIGSSLMTAILERAQELGYHVVLGRIVADNEASLRLGVRFGFAEVGRLREVGYKSGTLLDVVIQQKILGPFRPS